MARPALHGTLVGFGLDEDNIKNYVIDVRVLPDAFETNEDGTLTLSMTVPAEDLKSCKPNGAVRFDLHLNPRG